MRTAKLKSAYNSLIIGPTFVGPFLMVNQYKGNHALGIFLICVVGFDLRPLLEGKCATAKLKSAYNSLIIGPRGFGALSLRWIQFASVL